MRYAGPYIPDTPDLVGDGTCLIKITCSPSVRLSYLLMSRNPTGYNSCGRVPNLTSLYINATSS